jgi:membrane glycosyltransferase
MQKSKQIRPIKYKSIFSRAILESLFFSGFIAFFIIIFVGPAYHGTEINNKITVLFLAFFLVVSSIFIFVISGFLIIISRRFIRCERVLSGIVVYSVPIGYILAYNLLLHLF